MELFILNSINAALMRRREPMDEDAPPTESVFDSIGGQPLPRTVSIILGSYSQGTDPLSVSGQVPCSFADGSIAACPVEFKSIADQK